MFEYTLPPCVAVFPAMVEPVNVTFEPAPPEPVLTPPPWAETGLLAMLPVIVESLTLRVAPLPIPAPKLAALPVAVLPDTSTRLSVAAALDVARPAPIALPLTLIVLP